MPLDYNTVETIRFLVECEEKRSKIQIKWLQNHKKELEIATNQPTSASNSDALDSVRATMSALMPTIARNHAEAKRHRRKVPFRDAITVPGISHLSKKHSIPNVGLGDPQEDPRLAKHDTDLTPDPKMRPMDPKQRAIIYDSHHEFGRPLYIKSRNKIAPEKKYYFMESSGWECGWRLGDSFFGKQAPTYGRAYTITEGTLSLSGPQPDPPYYPTLSINHYSKCS